MKINLPPDVKYIIGEIESAGFEAYAVGGCVRDAILGREPADWDITTSAKPEEVKKIFRATIDTGIQHGTVTVRRHHTSYEVTTYRIDGEYLDSRHPEEVTFTAELREDLLRRDFTINAMAYNDRDGLIDLYDGQGDIERKIIRAVGDPVARFTEDALRIMRAVRFSAQLGYEIEAATAEAIRELAPHLTAISAERIQVELNKLITSPHPEKVRDLYTLGISQVILPELDRIMETAQDNPHHCYSVGEHTIRGLCAIAPGCQEDERLHRPTVTAVADAPAQSPMTAYRCDLADPHTLRYLRLAMLFHDMGKPSCKQRKVTEAFPQGKDTFSGHPEVSEQIAHDILRRLKYDGDTIRIVRGLVKYHDYRIGNEDSCSEKYVRRALNRIGEEHFPLLIEVMYADVSAQNPAHPDHEKKIADINTIEELYHQILEKKQCVSLKTLAVKGADLMAWGMEPGKEIGQMLQEMLELVLDEPEKNTKEDLRAFYEMKYKHET